MIDEKDISWTSDMSTDEEALDNFVIRCQMMERRAEKNRKKGNIFEEVEPQ